ncbi:MAG: 50S ribosomal protein L4 [Deltaproteobacteria bacterium]|nr:50S ribosomal protein L4 [Deltaproteobacteria bacterium]
MSENIELQVLNASGKTVGTQNVPAFVVDGSAPLSLVHQLVRWQRASWRAGTHAVKTRAQVSGGGVKPWKQKGTGRARSGSNTSPVWVGGGVAHGPKPRSYEFRINKTERKRALSKAISCRHEENRLIVVKEFGLTEIKTSSAQAILKQLGLIDAGKVLIVVSDVSEAVVKSFRNIKGIKLVDSNGLNVYDIMAHKYLVIESGAFDGLALRLK